MVATTLIACSTSAPVSPCLHRVKIEIKRVDDGSSVMQAIYRHGESQRDPAAATTGVRAEIDTWKWDELGADGLPRDNKRATDWYLRADDRAVLQRYIEGLAKQNPALAADRDHQFAFEHVVPEASESSNPYWRSYYLMSRTLIDDRAIANAGRPDGDYTSHPKLSVELTADGRKRFSEITRANAGHKLAILVDGIVSSAPIINGEIKGGKFWILTESPEAAKSVTDKLQCAH
jgi:SecD-like export protein